MNNSLVFEESDSEDAERVLFSAAESVELDASASLTDYSTSSTHYHGKHTNAHVTVAHHHDDLEMEMGGLSAADYTEIAKTRALAVSWALVHGERSLEQARVEVVYAQSEIS